MKSLRIETRWVTCVLTGLALLGWMNSVACGQDRWAYEWHRRSSAEQVLVNLRMESANAAQEWRSAKQQSWRTKDGLDETKRQVKDQIKSSAEYQATQERVADLHSKSAAARDQVLAQLQQDETYQAAKQTLDRAKVQLRESHSSNGTDDARQTAAKVLLEAKNTLKSIENQTVSKIPETRDLDEQLRSAQQHFAELNRKIQSETDHGSEVSSAKRSNAESFRNLKAAGMHAAQMNAAVTQQQQYVWRLGAEERAAAARDKIDDRDRDRRDRIELAEKQRIWSTASPRDFLPAFLR